MTITSVHWVYAALGGGLQFAQCAVSGSVREYVREAATDDQKEEDQSSMLKIEASENLDGKA